MKLTLNTNSANAGIAYVMAACNSKTTLPILRNILIRPSGDGHVQLTATNTEQQLSAKIPCEWTEKAPITIEGKKFADIFKKLPKDSAAKIELLANGKAVLKCGRSKFTLNTIKAEDYPSFNSDDAPISHTVNGSELRQAMDRCAVTMANGDVRYYLNGMHLNFNGTSVDVVATDGHRMNMAKLEATGEPLSLTIPHASVKPVMAVLSNDDTSLHIGETSLTASDGARTVTVKLIDGKYPDYMRVKPKSNGVHVVFSKAELDGAVSRALLLSNEKFRRIELSLANGQCDIIGSNGDNEQAEESIACSHNGAGFKINFNGQYLLDALGSIDTDSVTVQFGTESSPILIEDGNFSATVMPVRA